MYRAFCIFCLIVLGLVSTVRAEQHYGTVAPLNNSPTSTQASGIPETKEVGVSPHDSLPVRLGKAYGFLISQQMSLDRIKSEYPALAPSATIAESEFQASFGLAKKGIERDLQQIMGQNYPAFLAEVLRAMKKTTYSQQINSDIAKTFVAEVKSRATGDIASPFLETFLAYQFQERPAGEFLQGYTQVFRTKDHPKAQGVDFQIRYPMSWLPQEGDRLHIVQKLISQGGHGFELILLDVRDMPYIPSEKELADIFTESGLKQWLPAGAKFISAQPVVLDKNKGGKMIFDLSAQRLDTIINTRNVFYVTTYRDKMISLQCMVTNLPDSSESLQGRFARFEPLCTLVANSLVLHDLYTEAPLDARRSGEKHTTLSSITDYSADMIFLSFLITWGIGLTPPLLIRYVLLRRPMSKWASRGMVFLLLLVNLALAVAASAASGESNKTHAAVYIIAYVSYLILRSGTDQEKTPT